MDFRRSTVAAIVLGCLLSANAHAEHVTDSGALPTGEEPSGQHAQNDEYLRNTAFNRRFLERASRIGDIEIESETTPSGWGSFRYVYPNEYYGSDYELCLPKEKGAYLGVGTLRTLNAGASGRVSHLILFDFDIGPKLFNGALLQLTAMSENRYEFMSRLLTGKNHADLVKRAITDRMTPLAFAQTLPDVSSQKIVDGWRQSGVLIPRAGGRDYSQKVAEEAQEMIRAMKTFNESHRLYRTFFGSDERFANLKKLVHDGKISLVTGDLSAGKAFRDVAKALRKQGIQVSAVDISNAYQYFAFAAYGASESAHPNFTADLQSFPFSKNGRFLFTRSSVAYGRKRRRRGRETWNYYAISASKLKDFEQDLKRAQYYLMSSKFSEDPAYTNEQGVLYTLEGDRCPDPIGQVLKGAQFVGRKFQQALSGGK